MPSGEPEPENPREREQLLREIAQLSAGVRRLGLNLGSMRGVARTMDMFAAKKGNEVSAEDLEAAKRELVAAVRGLRRREAAHTERVSNLRFAVGAAALAALFGGAIVQRACDPIGRAHAHLTTSKESDASDEVAEERVETTAEEAPVAPPEPTRPQVPPLPPARPSPPTLNQTPPAARPPVRAPEVTPDRTRPRQRVAKAPREAGDTPIPYVIELTDSNFRHYTSRGIWVVDFYADWCGPCHAMKPVFASVFRANRDRRSNVNFGKFQVNDSPWGDYAPTASAHEVSGIPTFVFFKDGREIGRLEGAGHTSGDFERILSGSRYEDPLEGIELDDL